MTPHSPRQTVWYGWICFVLILLAGELVTRHLEAPLLHFAVHDRDIKQRIFHYSRSGQHEALFFGDSRAREGFVTPHFEKLTGLRSYNLSISAGMIEEIDAVVRDLALPHEEGLELAVIGLSPYMLNSAYPSSNRAPRYLWGYRDVLDYSRGEGGDLDRGDALKLTLGSVLPRRLALVRRRQEIRGALAAVVNRLAGRALMEQTRRDLQRYNPLFEDAHGYAPHGRFSRGLLSDTPPQEGATTAYAPHADIEPNPRRIAQLGRLVHDLQGAQLHVVIVVMPVSARLEASWTARVRRSMREALGVCARAGATIVEDNSASLGLDDGDFYDTNHLSLEGARRYTEIFARHLDLEQGRR